MSEIQQGWHRVTIMGDGGVGVPAWSALLPQGDLVHGWIRFRIPGGREITIHACARISEIERELTATTPEPEDIAQAQAMGDMVEVGRRRGRFRKRLKKFAKKLAKSKVVRGLAKTVKRVIDNPLVKGALSATPFGAAAYATRAAARIAAKAIKGGRKARQFIRATASGAEEGNPQAIAAMRLIRCGVLQHMPRAAMAVSGNDERRAFRVIAGWASAHYPAHVGVGCDSWSRSGADRETDHEIDALSEFASAGAWEGVRWLANQARLRSLNDGPHYSAKNAVVDGRAAMAARFA